MNTNRTRYQVNIPAYICVMLDGNLSVVSHYLDISTCLQYPDQIKPLVVDYTETATTHDIHHPDVRDQFGNALTYAKGLRVLNYNQLNRVTEHETPGREDIF